MAIATTPIQPPAITITVARDDWLSKIATRFYGDPNRWPTIYAANKATIGPDPNVIKIGQQLTIPSTQAKPDTKPDTKPDSVIDTNASAGHISALITQARALLGIPYVWGGTTKAGFDCSGLVQYLFGKAGITMPRTTFAQVTKGTGVSFADLRPGDLVFYYSGHTHVGIYIGDGQIIHAPRPGQSVRLAPVKSMPISAMRRVLPASATLPVVPASSTTTLSASSSTADIKAYAQGLMDPGQFGCFDAIVRFESGWNPRAVNPSSGAYGLGQALPGSKMASAGADWRTNPATQIKWTLSYTNQRYGSPCQARAFQIAHGWY